MKHPLVSIIIPVYNREKFIGECIESALAQTYTNIEIVVVDNASTDGTWEICECFAAKDQRVRVSRNNTNIGPVRNWLSAAKLSRGEFIKVLFSDDLLYSDCVDRMVSAIYRDNSSFAICSVNHGEGLRYGRNVYQLGYDRLLTASGFLKMLAFRRVPGSPGAALFFRSDFIANLKEELPTQVCCNFSSHGAGSDVMLYAFTALSSKAISYISEPLVFFRRHPGSLTVADENELVSTGYRVAFSWFFKRYVGRRLWSQYVSLECLRAIKRGNNPIAPKFLAQIEIGTFHDIVAVMCFLPAAVVYEIWHRIWPTYFVSILGVSRR